MLPEKLKLHNTLFYNAFRYSAIGMALVTIDGHWLAVNSSLCMMLGYSEEELLQMNFQQNTHPDDLELSLSYRNQLLEGSVESYLTEKRYIHKDGHIVWASLCASLLWDEHRRPQYFISQIQDITEKKLVENKLLETEKLYELISNNAQDIISYTTPDGICKYISPSVRTLLGYDPQQLIGQPLTQYYHPEDLALLLEKDFTDSDSITYRVRHNDGHWVWFETTVKFIRDENGEVQKALGVGRDITERKKNQDLLIEAMERYTSLKKYNPDAVISLDLKGCFLGANDATERLTGYTEQELFGKHFSDLVCEPFVKPVKKLFEKVIRGKTSEDAQLSIQNKAGAIVDILVTPAPIIVNNEIAGSFIIAKDITEQKKKDEYIRRSEKLTIAGELAAGIAHEIRNPLTAIKGFFQLMQTNGMNENYFDIIHSEFHRIELILSELLLLAKPQGTSFARKDGIPILNHVTALLESQANMNNVVIRTEFHVDALPLNCDENQIKQVFINIIKNAIEVMPSGGAIDIHVTAAGGQCVIRISDQGPGIPEEMLSNIGLPFYSTKENGTGLGLMVSYKIIENHGGKIHISSEPNLGTTFTITLPVA